MAVMSELPSRRPAGRDEHRPDPDWPTRRDRVLMLLPSRPGRQVVTAELLHEMDPELSVDGWLRLLNDMTSGALALLERVTEPRVAGLVAAQRPPAAADSEFCLRPAGWRRARQLTGACPDRAVPVE